MDIEAPELRPLRDTTAAEAAAAIRTHTQYLTRNLDARSQILRRVIVVAFGLVCGFVIYGSAQGWFAGLWWPIAIPLVAGVASAAVSRHMHFKSIGELYKRHQTRDQSFRLTDDGLAWSAPGMTSTIAWSGMSDIVDDEHRLMIFITPAQAITLTKAAYDSAALRAFATELTRRWQAARARSAS